MILGQRTTADDNFVLNAACKELIYKDFTSFPDKIKKRRSLLNRGCYQGQPQHCQFNVDSI